MLTKEHSIVQYKNGKVYPDRLSQKIHGHYLAFAQQMLDVYRSGAGKMRKELHAHIRKIFENEPDCPPRRIDAFCKLLDEAGVYDLERGKKAPDLRIKIFKKAALFHPLVQRVDRLFEHGEEDVKRRIAEDFKMTWDEIESEMFADIIEFHRLKEFRGYSGPEALLSKYNVAQVQAALFRAVRMEIHIGKDFKTILTYAKLARLLHSIELSRDGKYTIKFDGPASILRHTTRYGVCMAKFIPALLACSDWEMEARFSNRNVLRISVNDRLKSHLPAPEEFDSSFEQAFAEKWGDKPRDGWTLIREGGILHQGQKVFIPDFLFQHEDGRKVYLEIVGFWTPEYLKAKRDVLQLFGNYRPLVAIAESLNEKIDVLPDNAILFKESLALKDVLSYLSRI
ncbi:MAG: DUF790 family protein [Candidatus Omnitrophota bacterium]